MKRIFNALQNFAHTDLGDTIILLAILLAGMFCAHIFIWAAFAQGWN